MEHEIFWISLRTFLNEAINHRLKWIKKKKSNEYLRRESHANEKKSMRETAIVLSFFVVILFTVGVHLRSNYDEST